MKIQLIKQRLALILPTLLLSGCNPIFVGRVAYEEALILLRRREIEEVLIAADTTQPEKEKLELVLAARNYAKKISLNPGESFTQYTRINRDVLAWVLVASKPDAFELFTWWYPVVGSMPYKGYFDKKDAARAGNILESMGYESWIRPTEAFSTLGWFNDPLLSTTLANQHTQITNTVLHESTHSTVWVPNHVDFNESLANFVGHQANIGFYQELVAAPPASSLKESANAWLKEAQASKQRALLISAVIEKLYDELNQLYQSNLSRAEKITRRDQVFAKHIEPLQQANPGMRALKTANNAEIMQLKLYMTKLSLFDQIFTECGADWNLFLDQIRSIKKAIEDDSALSPWDMLKARTQNGQRP